MSARPAGRRTHPPLTVEGTDDQKDLSSALAEDVCLPDAPGRSEVGRSEIRDQRSKALAGVPDLSGNRMRHLFTMSNTRPQAQKSRRRISSKTSIITRISDRLPDGAPRITWWSQTGSNRRPHACKARALPTELWPPEVR